MVETIYVTTPGVSIHQDGGLLVLEQDHQVLKELPMTTVGNLVLGRTVQISTQVIFSLVKQGSLIQFVDYKYNVVGTLGDEHTTLSKLLWQAENFQDETFALRGAKYIVQRKVTAQLSILNRYNKTKSIPKYEFVLSTLERLLNRIKRTRTIDGLRGIEGLASKTYFSAWGSVLSKPWAFSGRKRHPSPDPVNAILSYGYSFLEREVRACLVTAGLDVRIGVLHSTNNRKDSFVYDVMDLLRQEVIDRFILKVLNTRRVSVSDFDISNRGCYMAKASNKKWIQLYEEYMTTSVTRFGDITPRQWIQREINSFMAYLQSVEHNHVA